MAKRARDEASASRNFVATACASGADALGYAHRLLAYGQVDRVAGIAADAMLTHSALTFFDRMRALTSQLDEPLNAPRPFDESRDGFVAGEGAAAVVLERDKPDTSARARLLGYGSSCDAHHQAAPDPTGVGIDRAVKSALADAALAAAEIVSINAHGTSTPLDDAIESEAMDRLYPAHVPATAVMSTTGHMTGASGLVEFIVGAHSASSGEVPATANTTTSITPRISAEPQQTVPGPVISHSFGFGGQSATLVVEGAVL